MNPQAVFAAGDAVRVFHGFDEHVEPRYGRAVVVEAVYRRRRNLTSHWDLRIRPVESFGDYEAGRECWFAVVEDAGFPYVVADRVDLAAETTAGAA